MLSGILKVDVLKHGVHSGQGSGVVPSAFTVIRELLNRIENPATQQMILPALQCEIPAERIEQAQQAASALDKQLLSTYEFVGQTQAIDTNPVEIILNRTWRAALSITGQDGLPPIETAGNVTLPSVSMKLSFRLPPTCDPLEAAQAIKQTLEQDPPYQASVHFDVLEYGPGWNAPSLAPWLQAANDVASDIFYKKPAAYIGEGGSIPFMGMLGDLFPQAQFLIAGVLGPRSNAHGPNEFLHIDMAKRLTGAVASVVASHFDHVSA